MRKLSRTICILFLLGGSVVAQSAKHTPEYTYKVVNSFPHDASSFTQGLVYYGGFLYEGTGLTGRSSLRKERLETGEVLKQINLAPDVFGEGIAIFGEHVIQLTWQSHVVYVYRLSDFQMLRQFSYPGEGWGLTSNGRELFMSDGTPEIRALNPRTLEEKRRITVRDGDTPVDQINELEWIDGEIFANIWQTDRIARISPQTGKVTGWIDLTGLLSPLYHLEPGAVLNGIAYDAARKRLFVTGKLWPKVFEIRVVPKAR